VLQLLRGPRRRLIRVTCRARIRNLVFVRYCGGDESKRVRSNFDIRNGCLNLWHVASDTATPRRPDLVMCVFFDGCRARTVQGERAVTIHA